jgi:hypothetical protein
MGAEAELYKRQMKQMNDNARGHLQISSNIILDTPNNEELGMLVRQMYWDKIKQLDEHAQILKDGK